VILGVDQGTSSTRCVAVTEDLRAVAAAGVPVACSFPAPGHVEQDPEDLAASVLEAIERARATDEVIALGIANQTETFVVWDRETLRPIHPAIVWQDRRTEPECAALRDHYTLVRERTGLELDATFPATKLAWLLDHVDGARARAEAGELAYGDVASWLLARLGGIHVTEAGNAGRSLLAGAAGPGPGVGWDPELLELFRIPPALLPPVLDSDALTAELAGMPVRAVAGDQQASLFALRCWSEGEAKVTLGTGAFLLVNAGTARPRPPAGVLGSCAWRREGVTSYALEGFVPTAGAAVDWFARVGALAPGPQLDAELRAGRDGVVCVPALQGLGTPSWDAGIRGALLGVDLGTTRADLARAVVDGVLHQVADALEAIGSLEVLRLDGGLARSDWVAQRLADLTGVRVERTGRPDATALGAAMLAGLAAGVWDTPAAIPPLAVDLVAEPAIDAAPLRERWAAARDLVAGWR
jgi:glycerol kinase